MYVLSTEPRFNEWKRVNSCHEIMYCFKRSLFKFFHIYAKKNLKHHGLKTEHISCMITRGERAGQREGEKSRGRSGEKQGLKYEVK